VPPLILLPPSEKKATGGAGVPWHGAGQSFPDLDEARREVIDALVDAMCCPIEARTKLLGVGAARAGEATAANLSIDTAPTMPAIGRYTGVLYDALDAGSLPAHLRKRLDEQVVVFSGLWGAVRPSDPIPDYKLKMGAPLPGLGRPARFWRPHLTAALTKAAAATVWDLLPNEHAAAWDPTIAGHRIRVRFLDDVERSGKRALVTVSHWNKLLKGALVRHLLEHRLDDPDGLVDFAHPEGYAYRPDLTTTSGNTTDIALVSVR
jgi:cytoplasmic iron level regulating protein YaaA (DUF328/UPF0246 family)